MDPETTVARISQPLANGRIDRRTSVEWNDAHLLHHLGEDGDIAFCLDDLMIVVVEGIRDEQASRRDAPAHVL
jgi:hypothetical protein